MANLEIWTDYFSKFLLFYILAESKMVDKSVSAGLQFRLLHAYERTGQKGQIKASFWN